MSALSCMFNKKAVIKRNMVASTSDSGEESLELEVVYDSVSCYVEPDAGKLLMMGAGRTDLDYKIMICDLYDSSGNQYEIKKGDVIVLDGISYQVDDTNDFLPPGIPHWEINITGGVL